MPDLMGTPRKIRHGGGADSRDGLSAYGQDLIEIKSALTAMVAMMVRRSARGHRLRAWSALGALIGRAFQAICVQLVSLTTTSRYY